MGTEEYSFSWNDLRQQSSKSDTSLKRELSRLVAKKEIINLRKGFYLILPPRYRNIGQLPIELYIEKLFKYLNKSYYLGLYSAARLHGASHQQIQQNYIITSLPSMLDIDKGGILINFYTSASWPERNVLQQKSDAGYFKVSSPALTAADLVHYQTKLGGLSRMGAILEELSEEIKEKDINDLLSWYPHKSTLQRLGYLLEEYQSNSIVVEHIFKHIKKEAFYPVVLSTQGGQKAGAVENRWKVFVNLEIEGDL